MQRARHALPLPALTLFALLVTVLAVYSPGLNGPWVFDDYPNIVNNDAVALESIDLPGLYHAAVSTASRIFARPLATLTFALNHYQTGGFTSTFWFKLTNLCIHLVNALLVYWLSRLLISGEGSRVTKSPHWLALAIAAAWALHPLNANPVLYVVQRMTSLAVMGTLTGLICFVHGRQLLNRAPRKGLAFMTVGAAGGMLFGLLAKEIALLLPLYMLCVDYFILRRPRQTWPPVVRNFHVITTGVFTVIAAYYLIAHRDHLFGIYHLRDFSMEERLLTQPRVLWFYISLFLVPVPRRFSLFHDDFAPSLGLLDPWTTILALGGILTAIALAFVSRKRYPIAGFAICWFLCGHLMESSIIGLELVHEHRNYLPSFGLIFLAAYAFTHAGALSKRPRTMRLAGIMIIGILGFGSYVRASYWADEASLAQFTVTHHPGSPRAHAFLAEWLLKNELDAISAVRHYKTAGDLPPREASYLIRAAHILAVMDLKTTPGVQADPDQLRRAAGLPSYVLIRGNGDNRYLTMDASVLNSVKERLVAGPIHLRIVEALGRFAHCVEENVVHCDRQREEVFEWHKLALANPRTNHNMQKQLMSQIASLYINSGQLESALELVERARTLDPQAPGLALMQANILYLQRKLEPAKRILYALESEQMLDSIDREQLEKLKYMVEKNHEKR